MIPGLIGSFIRAHKVLSKNLNSAFNSKQMLDAFLQSKNYKVKRNLILSPRARVSDRKALIAEYPSIVQENLLGILNVPIISKKTPDITDYLKNPRKDSMSVYPSYRPLSDSVFMTSVVNDIQGHYLMLPSRIEVRKMAKGLASPSEKWVDSLLLRTPIMFVVVQTNRLFSDASLNQMNPPYIKLQNAITNLNRETPTGGGRGKARAMYNMHDIVPIKKFNQVLGGGGDALVKEIIKHSKVEITDSNFIPVGGQPVGLDVTSSSTRDDLLYDLKYTSFKLLTIEKDGDQSHEKFLNLLESFKGDFKLVGMRLGLNSKWVNDSLAKKATTRELPRTGSDSISKIILSLEKKNTPSNFDDIMTRVGEWGLTVAKRGKNSIYLLKE